MGLTAISGPFHTYGITESSTGGGLTGQPTEYNEERGPSIFDLGTAIADPRVAFDYEPGAPVGTKLMGFFNNQAQYDWVPFAPSSAGAAVSTTAQPVANTTITLSPSSSSGFITTTIVAPESGIVTSVVAIESTAAFLTFGSAGTITMWNPAFGAGRTVSINPSSSGDIGPWTVAGRDVYGFKLTETLFSSIAAEGFFISTSASGLRLTTRKAFKYLTSVTAATSTITSTGVGIGVAEGYGMPLLVDEPGGLNIQIAVISSQSSGNILNAGLLSSAGFFGGSTAAAQTSTTPDVRGLLLFSSNTPLTAGGSASGNAVRRYQIAVTPRPTNLASITSTNVAPLFGATQFSSV